MDTKRKEVASKLSENELLLFGIEIKYNHFSEFGGNMREKDNMRQKGNMKQKDNMTADELYDISMVLLRTVVSLDNDLKSIKNKKTLAWCKKELALEARLREAEEIKKNAIAKLTPEEMQALGLKV